jgi:hypothetical protein
MEAIKAAGRLLENVDINIARCAFIQVDRLCWLHT